MTGQEQATEINLTDTWSRDLACVMNNLQECLALRVDACVCRQMPKSVYTSRWDEFHDRLSNNKRQADIKRQSRKDVRENKGDNENNRAPIRAVS